MEQIEEKNEGLNEMPSQGIQSNEMKTEDTKVTFKLKGIHFLDAIIDALRYADTTNQLNKDIEMLDYELTINVENGKEFVEKLRKATMSGLQNMSEEDELTGLGMDELRMSVDALSILMNE